MAFLQNIQLTLLPEQAGESSLLKEEVAKKIHVRREEVTDVRIIRKSIDARSRSQVKINLCVDVYTKGTKPQPISYPFQYQDVSKGEPVLVIGAGPAGLFGALRLIELGFKPIIIERGKEVSDRKKDIAQLNRNNGLNTESNYCFGEGGAGTFLTESSSHAPRKGATVAAFCSPSTNTVRKMRFSMRRIPTSVPTDCRPSSKT